MMKKKRRFVVPGLILGLFLLFYVMGGGLTMFSILFSGVIPDPGRENLHSGSEVSETAAKVDYKDAYNGSGVPDVLSQEVLDKYLSYMKPADDAYDFRYATDYSDWSLVKLQTGRDQSSYEKILGYGDATLEEIKQALDRNENISATYKDFIYNYAVELRTLYPDINLAVLRHNLETLVIDEMTQAQIDKETLSTDSAACYLRYENRICVLEDLDLSRESDDYIILVHELSHAARSVQVKEADVVDYDTDIGFYDYYLMGTYAEEGIITNIAYELQGLGKKATFYPMLASYYRIICDCIGYTGEDFFNHSVNYLIDQMDAFMGDEQYAYQVVAMIDAQMSLRYTPYQGVDFHDFQPMYEYLARMYFKKHISAEMDYSAAKAVFDDFYAEITFNFENMNRKYDVDENTFLPTFEKYISEMGIAK